MANFSTNDATVESTVNPADDAAISTPNHAAIYDTIYAAKCYSINTTHCLSKYAAQ